MDLGVTRWSHRQNSPVPLLAPGWALAAPFLWWIATKKALNFCACINKPGVSGTPGSQEMLFLEHPAAPCSQQPSCATHRWENCSSWEDLESSCLVWSCGSVWGLKTLRQLGLCWGFFPRSSDLRTHTEFPFPSMGDVAFRRRCHFSGQSEFTGSSLILSETVFIVALGNSGGRI